MVKMNLFPGQEYRYRLKNRHVDTEEGKGQGGMNWEIDGHIYTTLHGIASGNLLESTGSSTRCSVKT